MTLQQHINRHMSTSCGSSNDDNIILYGTKGELLDRTTVGKLKYSEWKDCHFDYVKSRWYSWGSWDKYYILEFKLISYPNV